MKHLRWMIALFIPALAASCDTAPVDPATADGASAGTPSVSMTVLSFVPQLNEANGHVYAAVAAPDLTGITWTEAKEAAEASSEGGCPGYLVSITSAEENEFIATNLPEAIPIAGRGYWIGAEQAPGSEEPAGGWGWVSGESFEYAHWSAGQPDNISPLGPEVDEDVAHYSGGTGFGFGSPEPRWSDLNRAELAPGYVVEYAECTLEEVVAATVQVKPGEGLRPINPKSRGKTPVVVLSADGFDAATIDPATVTLGDGDDDGDVPVARRKNGTPMASFGDVDGDGLEDAVFHFHTQELVADLGLGGAESAGVVELKLRGMAGAGSAESAASTVLEFEGTDTVRIL